MPCNVTDVYLAAARVAAALLAAPAVAEHWTEPSALSEFAVSGLAGHLARQITAVPAVLHSEFPDDVEIIGILGHYARSPWVGAALDDEVSAGIRRAGEDEAEAGPAALAERTIGAIGAIGELAVELGGPVFLPWAGWALTPEDYLTTRLLEIVIHADDLAVSVGVTPPDMPGEAVDTVVVLLARLAVRRHGATAVLRTLSRKERAPETIAAL